MFFFAVEVEVEVVGERANESYRNGGERRWGGKEMMLF